MMTIEQFRVTIYNEVEMLRRYNDKYRLAEDFGIVRATGSEVIFYFERVGAIIAQSDKGTS